MSHLCSLVAPAGVCGHISDPEPNGSCISSRGVFDFADSNNGLSAIQTMRIAYLDCASGASGDMSLGALVDAGADLATIQEGLDSLGIGCRLNSLEVKRCGFRACHIRVEHKPEHAHRRLSDIVALIDQSRLTDIQKDLAGRIFRKLAEAEAKVHGTTLEKVHFHEVGAVDSIADIVGAAIGFSLLGVEQVVASPTPTGRGSIEIAHGRCSIPAPATAELLRGIPLAESDVEAELTTPTGAAILATIVDRFGPPPAMTIDRIGYGAGARDLTTQPNVLRLLVGEAVEAAPGGGAAVWLVETNLDDASGEVIGYAIERLWQEGALDVSATPLLMKKNRPGVKLTVLCDEAHRNRIESILFRETTTLGVRRWRAERTILAREPVCVSTAWGEVAGIVARCGDAETFSPEYESCRRIALEKNLPLREVYEAARRGFEEAGATRS